MIRNEHANARAYFMKKYLIYPSLLSADFTRLGEESKAVLAAGADGLHFDVMDQHFVPNLTMGSMFCSALRKSGITAPIDVHLMTSPVDALIQDFAKAGANRISIHPEACLHLDRSLTLIRELGCKAGVVLNPATPLSCLDFILDRIDFILVMTVNPGFGGQTFIPFMTKKIIALKKYLQEKNNLQIEIAVDGGINLQNICEVAQAGATTFIAGSAIFGTRDYQKTIEDFRCALQTAAHLP